MPKGPPPRSPKEIANQEILARLRKAVASHYHTIAQEFENFDTTKTDTASRDEFRAICTRHVQVLTDEQFDRLWAELPVNAKGRLRYLDFLSGFSSEKAVTPPATGDSARAQRGSSVPEVSEGSRSAGSSPARDLKSGSKPRSHPCTLASATPPLQNCEPIETKLRKKVQGCWRELLRECKERDANRQGDITATEFLALVEKFSLGLNRDECQQLILKYDLKNNGRFAYCDFIQSCVLLLRAKETSLMQRMKIQNAHKMKEAGAETSSFYSALLRIQPKIVHCWRPMRRTFKAYDEEGTGLLSVADFRKVSTALVRLLLRTGSSCQMSLARKLQKRILQSPAGGPGVGNYPRPHSLGTPRLSRADPTGPSAADPRLSSLKVSRTLQGQAPVPAPEPSHPLGTRTAAVAPQSPGCAPLKATPPPGLSTGKGKQRLHLPRSISEQNDSIGEVGWRLKQGPRCGHSGTPDLRAAHLPTVQFD